MALFSGISYDRVVLPSKNRGNGSNGWKSLVERVRGGAGSSSSQLSNKNNMSYLKTRGGTALR